MCILIVEDEFMIRMMLVERFADEGFDLLEAESGDQACALIEKHADTIDALVTDVHMPGKLNGIDVARCLRKWRPNVPIVFMTARPEAVRKANPIPEKPCIVEKPFAPSDLLTVVRRLLGRRQVSPC